MSADGGRMANNGILVREGDTRPDGVRFFYKENIENPDGDAYVHKNYKLHGQTAYIQPHYRDGAYISSPLPSGWSIEMLVGGYPKYVQMNENGEIVTTTNNRPQAPKLTDMGHAGIIYQIVRAVVMRCCDFFITDGENPVSLVQRLDIETMRLLDADLNQIFNAVGAVGIALSFTFTLDKMLYLYILYYIYIYVCVCVCVHIHICTIYIYVYIYIITCLC